MILHVFTSSKGGVGKTLLSSGSAAYLINKKNRRVLCLDLNWQNTDFSSIMSGDESHRPPMNPKYQFTTVNKGLTVISRNRYLHEPYDNIGFWKLINKGVEEAEEQSNSFDHIIVDTCFHISNLTSSDLDKDKEISSEIQNLNSKKVTEIYFWFIWTLRSLSRKNDWLDIERSLKAIEIMCKDASIRIHVINIINPIAVFMEIDYWDAVVKKIKSWTPDWWGKENSNEEIRGIHISSFETILRDKIVKEIDFNEFKNTVEEELKDKVDHPLILLEKIGTIFKRKFNGRPRNLFLIPTLDKDLQGFTDTYIDGQDGVANEDIFEKMGEGIDFREYNEKGSKYQSKLMDGIKRLLDGYNL